MQFIPILIKPHKAPATSKMVLALFAGSIFENELITENTKTEFYSLKF
jgi:hypothetical protein